MIGKGLTTSESIDLVAPAGGSHYLAIKRALDFVMALFLLLLLLPLFVLVAISIKIWSPGPVLYPWKVVGEGGRPFIGYKFRTMVPDADSMKPRLLNANEMGGPVFKMKNDPRITRLGRYIRKFSIDELPQLWSVLKGDMSLVGPRPPLRTEYSNFTGWQKQKLAVKPGITCLWQIRGRNEVRDFDDWVQLDLEYIQRRGFLLDLKILVKTFLVVVKGTGR